MITLTVVSFNNAPSSPLSASFDELGGSIGRADTNQLVLPDPERSISRVHAQVVFRGGRYAIVDKGSNPVSVNGRPLGNGSEALLNDGDQVQIGGYMLKVAVQAGGAAGGLGSKADPSDPFADLMGAGFGGAPAKPLSAGLPPPAPAPNDPLAAFGFGAPAAGGGAGAAADPFGFAAPAAPAAPRPANPQAASGGFGAGPAPAAGGIPDDWDPFAPDPGAATAKPDLSRSLGASGNFGLEVGGGAQAPLIPDLPSSGASSDNSIDALFGLGGGSMGGDPLANSLLDDPLAKPNMAASSDPMKSLRSAAHASATAAPDNSSALNQPFIPAGFGTEPQAPRAAAPVPAATPSPRPPSSPGLPGGAVLSWGDDAGESRTIIRPSGKAAGAPPAVAAARPAAAAPTPSAQAPVASAPPLGGAGTGAGSGAGAGAFALPDDDALFAGLGPAPAGSTPPTAPAPAAPFGDLLSGAGMTPLPAGDPFAAAPATGAPLAAAAAAAGSAPAAAPAAQRISATPATTPPTATGAFASADTQALLAAFREGLACPTVPVEALTPELMRLIGQLLHESARGTVDLLVARAALKREIRAEVTMIVARENNPLKFSPSVEVALGHLLSPPARGFMPAGPAMRDAYDDLRAHQFGFVAGMRAALEGLLKRFDPAELEGRLTQKSVLSSLLPGSRKARMWEVFQELYAQISAEAADDFHELFGKAFLEAYEAHIDELKKDAP